MEYVFCDFANKRLPKISFLCQTVRKYLLLFWMRELSSFEASNTRRWNHSDTLEIKHDEEQTKYYDDQPKYYNNF